MSKYLVHPDPLDLPAPDQTKWSPLQLAAWKSPEMEAFREGFRLPGLPDIRSAVLDDLSSYFKVDAEACIHLARHSVELSAKEWLAIDRSKQESVTEFYLNVHSYVFGILWYAYLQAEGYIYPVAVVVARDLRSHTENGKVLDFGSGVGPAGQMFVELGYEVTLADISTPMLDFARYRLERRGEGAKYINLNRAALAPSAYDTVAAINTLAAVPNIFNTASMLHAAISLDGKLYADIDVSPRPVGAQRLYDDDLFARMAVRRAGFVAEKQLDYMVRYRRVPASGAGFVLRNVRDNLVLGDARRIARRLRRLAG